MIPTDSDEEQLTIRQLAFSWAQVELLSGQLSCTDYIRIISGLQVITDNLDRTTQLVTAVIDQTAKLGRSSGWVEQETEI